MVTAGSNGPSRCDPTAYKCKYRGQQLDQKDRFVLLCCRCSTSRALETRLWCHDCSQSLWVQSGPSDIGFPSSFCAGPVQLSAVLTTERITPSSPKCNYGPCCGLDSGMAAAVAGVNPGTVGLRGSADILKPPLPDAPLPLFCPLLQSQARSRRHSAALPQAIFKPSLLAFNDSSEILLQLRRGEGSWSAPVSLEAKFSGKSGGLELNSTDKPK